MIIVKATFIIELWRAPGFENHVEIFFKAITQIVERNTEGQRFPLDESMTNAELEPAVAPAIERRIVFGDAERIVIRQEQHSCAYSYFFRSLGNRRPDDTRRPKHPRNRMKVMLREPHGLESDLLPISDLINDSAKPLRSFRARSRKRRRQIEKPIPH